jgi:uncharacterized protein (TIGR02246 family)
VRAVAAAFATAYNEGRSDAIAATFAEDSQVTDESGNTIEGRDAITKQFAATFAENPGAKIELSSKSLRFLSPDVAIEEGQAKVRNADALADDSDADVTDYTAIYVKRDGRWLHASVRDHVTSAAILASPHEHLQELAWMVGDWIEEGPDSVSSSNCRWDDSGNFLVWRYRVDDKNANAGGGTTFIGWDPLSGQITSWVFDSEGGHGEATWTRVSDDQWMVKASGTLADGRTASATQYIKRLGPDRTSWTSLDRVAGGQAVPDISEYVLVRQPARPGPASRPAAAVAPSSQSGTK